MAAWLQEPICLKNKKTKNNNKKPHASGKFLQHIKNIHSILKGITTKKKKRKKQRGEKTWNKNKHEKYCLHSHPSIAHARMIWT